MIPSRPLDLGGIIGESIRIIKRIYWRAAIFLIIFTAPGLIILSFGIDKTFDGMQEVTQKYTAVSPEAPVLVRDYFLAGMSRSGSMWLYRLQYPEIFSIIDSVKTTIASKYPDSAQAKIEVRLDSIVQAVNHGSGKSTVDLILTSITSGLIILFIGIFLYILAMAAVWAALFDLSSRAFEERPFSFGPIFRQLLTRSMWLLMVQFILVLFAMLTGFGLVIGITAVISPILGVFGILASFPILIYAAIRIMFSGIALVSEESGPFEAVKRSLELTANMFWRIFGISLIVGILIYIIMILIRLPFSLILSADTDWITDFIRGNVNIPRFFAGIKNACGALILSGLLSSAITVSFFPAFLTTFYYDLRTRNDGALEYPSELETENEELSNDSV